jgi:D-glycerate 3-kinase
MVPRYDKALRNGRGDRAHESKWLSCPVDVDVVLFEGWMLGFTPVDADDGDNHCSSSSSGSSSSSQQHIRKALAQYPGLREVNSRLRSYADLHEMFDAWLVIAVDTVNNLLKDESETAKASKVSSPAGPAGIDAVFKWRLEAETAMKAKGLPGLSEEQVADFVSRFIPAYKLYLPELYANGPQRRRKTREESIRSTNSHSTGSNNDDDDLVPVLKVRSTMRSRKYPNNWHYPHECHLSSGC